jgi:hypothetical protein
MPLYNGFCGPSNPSQSLQADCERTVNWMIERVESPTAPTGAALYPTPGQQTFLTTTDLEPRAVWSQGGRAFAVIGTGFYEVFSTGIATSRGTVALDSNPATISYNGTTGGQLFITSGGNGYCYVLATNTLTQVLTGEATMGGMINARFLAFNTINGKVRLSALNDGTTWDPTLFFQRTQAPDPWQMMVINPPEIWLIGEQTGEVWYDSGAFPQPFAPIPGAFFKYGTPAAFSGALVGDYVIWLSRTKDGAGSIVAAKGYTPAPISNYAIETAIGGYARTASIADCELMAYADQGHLYACFAFPTAKRTHVCDLSMNMLWHERARWDSANNRFDVWGPRVHVYAFNKHLVGNRGSGALSQMDVTFGSESDGSVIRRLRIPPPLWATSRQRLVVDRLEVKAESGLGLTTGQGSDPQMMMRVSTDAKTWGAERMASAGPLGQYGHRIVWNRCGSSEKIWVPELTVTDPIPWRISGAEIDGTGFAQTQQAAA